MIGGDQVGFRALNKNDLPHFVQWLNDPEVRQGLSLIIPRLLTDGPKAWKNESPLRGHRQGQFCEGRHVDVMIMSKLYSGWAGS